MAATTAAVVGIATAVGSAGASAKQASNAAGFAKEAESKSKIAFEKAMKELSANKIANIGLQKEAFELEREALLSSGAQAIQAGVESERGAAATAGRVQMAQNQGQRDIAGAMAEDLMGLEKATAAEEARLSGLRSNLNLAQAEGAAAAAAQFGAQKDAAVGGIFAGLSSAAQQGIQASDLYKKTEGTREYEKLESEYNKAAKSGKLGNRFKDQQTGGFISFEQAIPRLQSSNEQLTGLKGLKANEITDFFVKRPDLSKSIYESGFSSNDLYLEPGNTNSTQVLSPGGIAPGLRFNSKPLGF